MRIKKIEINNFRCFETISLAFEKCHALIGENGTGKTAILEAINLATSLGGAANKINEQDFNNLDEKDELLIKVFFDPLFISKVPDGYGSKNIPCQGVKLTAHRRNRAASGRALSPQFVVSQTVIPLEYESANKPDLHHLRETDLPAYVQKTSSGYKTIRKNGKSMELDERVLTLQNEMIGFPNVFYFPKDREKESKTGFSTLLKKVSTDLNWRYRTKWDQDRIVEKWEDFYAQVIDTVEDEKGGRIINPIRDKLNDFVGRNFENLELSLLDLEQPFSKSFFSQRSRTNIIEQNNLGSGISILLSFFLLETISLLSKNEIIILIDEPELHLHPQLQQKFLTTFVQESHQVIYTTQSDCFIDIAEWRSISRFCKERKVHPSLETLETTLGGKTIGEHLDEIKKWHQQKTIFFREDNQIFFASKCVLLEGPAEKYGFPILAQNLGIDLQNLFLLSCNGKQKIPYYQLLCKSFEIPYYTVLDLDDKTETDEENRRIIDSSLDGAVVKFSSSFEKILGISTASEHKASDTLIKIDSLKRESIPPEIKDAIMNISTWFTTN